MKLPKASRLKKLTWKLLVIFAGIILLIALSNPDPEKPFFWVGIGLLFPGMFVRVWAAGHLVKNKRLTTTGPYAFVKNPLYVGTFFIMVGFCILAQGGRYNHWALNNMNWFLLAIGVVGFVVYYIPYKKKNEGDRLLKNFGDEWKLYDENVPNYFPRLSPWRHPKGEPVRWSFKIVCENSEQWVPIAVAAGVAAIIFSPQIMDLLSNG